MTVTGPLLFLPSVDLSTQDHSCVKIPKDMDFSAIDRDPPHILKGFDAKQLQGTWYKVRIAIHAIYLTDLEIDGLCWGV